MHYCTLGPKLESGKVPKILCLKTGKFLAHLSRGVYSLVGFESNMGP